MWIMKINAFIWKPNTGSYAAVSDLVNICLQLWYRMATVYKTRFLEDGILPVLWPWSATEMSGAGMKSLTGEHETSETSGLKQQGWDSFAKPLWDVLEGGGWGFITTEWSNQLHNVFNPNKYPVTVTHLGWGADRDDTDPLLHWTWRTPGASTAWVSGLQSQTVSGSYSAYLQHK